MNSKVENFHSEIFINKLKVLENVSAILCIIYRVNIDQLIFKTLFSLKTRTRTENALTAFVVRMIQ